MPDALLHFIPLLLVTVVAVASAMEKAVAALIVFGGGAIVGALICVFADYYASRRHGR